MSQSIAAQLQRLLPDKISPEAVAAAERAIEDARSTGRPIVVIQDPEVAELIRRWKGAIRCQLQLDPVVTPEMIADAEACRSLPGHEGLPAFIAAVQEAMEVIGDDPARRQRFLEQAFRRRNPDLTIPE